MGSSYRRIGVRLNQNHSVIAREVNRHGGRSGYGAMRAQRRSDANRSRPNFRALVSDRRLHDEVARGLDKKWSLRQTSKRLRQDFPFDDTMWVSHETVYQTLYLQERGELRTQLKLALRRSRMQRMNRSRASVAQGKTPGMVNISERLPEAEDRSVPGLWEGDLIIGKNNKSQIATIVERQTRFVMLVRIPYDRNVERVSTLLGKKMEDLPKFLCSSITWGQGKELAMPATFIVKTGIDIYFWDPRSPWQRGSNENNNGLLHQYFPKGTELSGYTQVEIDAVADELNDRPRQTLDWLKPAEVLNKLLLGADGAPAT